VVTTPNKRKLEEAVGVASALEIGGREEDLRRVSKAVEAQGLFFSSRQRLCCLGHPMAQLKDYNPSPVEVLRAP
jgi:hypothetical protein